MRKNHEFDELGRHRPIDHAGFLANVDKRAANHLRGCIRCLQCASGLVPTVCAVAKQIQTQREAVLRGQRATEDEKGRGV